MIGLTRLQVFLAVAQCMSFSEAAAHLHLTQPTISHHIKVLERELGAPLFERTGNGLRLTEAGSLLVPRARRLVHDAIKIQQVIESLDERVAGHLRIACSSATGKYVLPLFAARFHERHPDITVSVVRCAPPDVVAGLLGGSTDLGVISNEADTAGMECQEFFNDHIILIVPPRHPWAVRPCVEPSELVDVPLIIREPTSGTRRALLTQLGQHNILVDDLNVFLEVGNSEAIIKTVEAGFGVSFVSRLAAAWALELGTVVEVPLAGCELHRTVYVARPEMQAAHRAVDAFWGFVHDPSNADLRKMAEK
jgi:DNA-binding transcriptional LysR family regulator